jgi:tetratricopeptide (TPR) repeat protein
VRLILDDARTYLASTDETYDLIISEPSNPWMTGVSNLFTKEFFELARARLAPRGRLLQWIQLYGIDPPSFSSILAAVRGQFPFVYAFSNSLASPDLLVLATAGRLTSRDLPRWEKLPAPVRRDLARIGSFSTTDLWSLVRLAPAHVDQLLRAAVTVNTDDNLYVELTTPWLVNTETVHTHWSTLARFPDAVLPVLRAAGEPIGVERIADLAFSYANQRGDAIVTERLLGEIVETGPRAALLAAAVAAARSAAPDSDPTGLIPTLDEAVNADPAAFGPRLLRAEVRLAVDDPAGALADADAALAARAAEPRARIARARSLVALDRTAEAEAEIDGLVASSLGLYDPDLYKDQALVKWKLDKADEAIVLIERHLATWEPRWREGWRVLAEAYAHTGDARAGERARRNLALVDRREVQDLHHMARYALWEKQYDDAASLLSLVLMRDPDNELARSDLEQVMGRTD